MSAGPGVNAVVVVLRLAPVPTSGGAAQREGARWADPARESLVATAAAQMTSRVGERVSRSGLTPGFDQQPHEPTHQDGLGGDLDGAHTLGGSVAICTAAPTGTVKAASKPSGPGGGRRRPLCLKASRDQQGRRASDPDVGSWLVGVKGAGGEVG